jgi:hypothetical protein
MRIHTIVGRVQSVGDGSRKQKRSHHRCIYICLAACRIGTNPNDTRLTDAPDLDLTKASTRLVTSRLMYPPHESCHQPHNDGTQPHGTSRAHALTHMYITRRGRQCLEKYLQSSRLGSVPLVCARSRPRPTVVFLYSKYIPLLGGVV